MIPRDLDVLTSNVSMLKALGLFAQDVIGASTAVSGLACSPSTPAALSVQIGIGRIYSPQVVDAGAYGSLPADATSILKQGVLSAPVTLSTPAPVVAGQSIAYLVEAQYQDVDGNSTVLGYFNALNPLSPLSGAGGLGVPQATQRMGIAAVQVKAGTSAVTGTQVVPSVDAGWTGLYVVTIAFGAASVVSGNIAQYPGAPFLAFSALTALTQANADGRYLQLYYRTPAEITSGITPTFINFLEGDIRRYGATTVSVDNTLAINSALLVNQNGGAAVYIPPGTWKHTSTLTPAGNSSMYGAGGVSILAPQGCDCLTFGIGTFYSTTGGFARFFRDFQIIGNNAVNSPNSAIVANFTAASTNRVAGVQFSNIFIANFNKGFNVRGIWNCSIFNCFGYNNYYGIFFIGQNIRTVIEGGGWVRGTITGAGGAWGVSLQQAAGESTQSTQMVGAYTFGYDIGINCILALETQIDNCDISSNQSIGVSVTSTVGGFWLTNSWVEMQNVGGAVTTGVAINSIASPNFQDIHINSNHITNDNPFAGSVGVSIANAQVSGSIFDNRIENFDQGIFNLSSSNLSCKNNRISILTPVYSAASYAILLNSASLDNEIGPNYIEPGNATTLPSFFQAATMANASANIGVTASASFPVGTPVQVDATQNGFFAGVTYFVLTSSANVLTLAPVAGGTAIVATGAVAVNIFAAPLPLNFNAATPAGLTFYGRGAFIATVSGYAAPVLAPMNWVASGKLISIAVTATITGTSTVATLGATGLPAFLNPITAKQMLANVTDSGAATYGMLGLGATGTMTFSKSPAATGGFTASGTKAINPQDMIYSIS